MGHWCWNCASSPRMAWTIKKQSLGRANAAKFIERLCKYPGTPEVIKEAERHILKAYAERLSKETGKKVTREDIEAGHGRKCQGFFWFIVC